MQFLSHTCYSKDLILGNLWALQTALSIIIIINISKSCSWYCILIQITSSLQAFSYDSQPQYSTIGHFLGNHRLLTFEVVYNMLYADLPQERNSSQRPFWILGYDAPHVPEICSRISDCVSNGRRHISACAFLAEASVAFLGSY